jgi:hypothetical protein
MTPTLVWLWPIEDAIDRADMRHQADLDLAAHCHELGVMPADRVRYFICRNLFDVQALRTSAGIPARQVLELAAELDRWPMLVGVVFVRELDGLAVAA